MIKKYLIVIPAMIVVMVTGLYGADTAEKPEGDAGKKEKKTIISYESLLVPVIPPKGLKYGLQTGLYLNKDDMKIQQQLLTQHNYQTEVLEVQDMQKQHWYLLVVLPYKTIETAEKDQFRLQFLLDIRSGLIGIPGK